MRIGSDRIITTHRGRLPRPAPLLDLLEAENTGDDIDRAALHAEITTKRLLDWVGLNGQSNTK